MATQTLQLPSEIQKETASLQRQISSLKVTDGDTYSLAIDIGKQIKSRIKSVTEFFAPMKRKAQEAKQAILDAEQSAIAPLEEAASYLNRQATIYRLEEERKANQARAEAQEAERKRIATLRAAEAAQAREQGKGKLAAAIEAAPIDVPAVELPPSHSLPSVSGTRKQTYWKFEITDAALVPREWCCPDERRIGEFVREQKEDAKGKIPGVRVYPDHKTF
jgi:hypothetical protein